MHPDKSRQSAAGVLAYARDTLARPNVTSAEISHVASRLREFQDDPEVSAFIEGLKATRA